jgi:hypothetical protein
VVDILTPTERGQHEWATGFVAVGIEVREAREIRKALISAPPDFFSFI